MDRYPVQRILLENHNMIGKRWGAWYGKKRDDGDEISASASPRNSWLVRSAATVLSQGNRKTVTSLVALLKESPIKLPISIDRIKFIEFIDFCRSITSER